MSGGSVGWDAGVCFVAQLPSRKFVSHTDHWVRCMMAEQAGVSGLLEVCVFVGLHFLRRGLIRRAMSYGWQRFPSFVRGVSGGWRL